jgi:hypothetical protein
VEAAHGIVEDLDGEHVVTVGLEDDDVNDFDGMRAS